MFPQRKMNIKTVCMLRKLFFIIDSMEASCARITHSHNNRLMTKLGILIANHLDKFADCLYLSDDEGGSDVAGVFNVDDVLARFSIRASICLTCLEL